MHSILGSQSSGVTGKHAGLADVVQAQEQHDHALHAYPCTPVRPGSVPEAVDVVFDALLVEVHALGLDSLCTAKRGQIGCHLRSLAWNSYYYLPVWVKASKLSEAILLNVDRQYFMGLFDPS